MEDDDFERRAAKTLEYYTRYSKERNAEAIILVILLILFAAGLMILDLKLSGII